MVLRRLTDSYLNNYVKYYQMRQHIILNDNVLGGVWLAFEVESLSYIPEIYLIKRKKDGASFRIILSFLT